jgi:hypothetical protein
MNDNLLLGIVFVVAVVALYLLYRSRRPVQQRCPACHRLGHGQHYGRYRCSSCGAHFVLDPSGRPSRTVWDTVYVHIWILLLIAACLIVALVTGARGLPAPVAMLLVAASSGWEMRCAFREKLFCQDDKAGRQVY